MNYNRFERARIVGARALQIAMGAPIILEAANTLDPVRASESEFNAHALPITVTRPDRTTVRPRTVLATS